jgi:hypothetical protein
MHQFDTIFVLPLTFGQPTKQLDLERTGRRSTSIFDTAPMCAGVVPQQPPISLAPCVAISRAAFAK